MAGGDVHEENTGCSRDAKKRRKHDGALSDMMMVELIDGLHDDQQREMTRNIHTNYVNGNCKRAASTSDTKNGIPYQYSDHMHKKRCGAREAAAECPDQNALIYTVEVALSVNLAGR